MTLDEAIKHCLEVAERQEKLKESKYISDIEVQYCDKCAADHRQLAEWLTELKELRSIVDACNILAVDAFAVENLCKELKEAKKLLKAAVEDITFILSYTCSDEEMCCEECPTENHACNKWRYADEALKLIGGEEQ